MNPRVFVVSGPSGVGKSTIIKKAMEEAPELALSISHTTREPREGEVEGGDYYFVSREVFEKMIEQEGFLEWAEVYGNYYGTGRAHVESLLEAGKHALLDVDTQGGMNIKTLCTGVVFVFIKPPSLNQLEVRLRQRGTENDASLFKRLSHAEHEIGFAGEYDHVIVNEEVERATEELVRILRAAEQEPVPFFWAGTVNSGFEELLGDNAFLDHLRSKLRERILENFSDQVRTAVRTELLQLVNRHLDSVLERELDTLLQATLSAREIPKS